MVKITICGAGGGIGQNLALLLHTSLKDISHLALYDVANAQAVAKDLRYALLSNITPFILDLY